MAANILDSVSEWPTGKKTAVLAVLVVTAAIVLLLSSWFQKADYQVLYSNLSENDAGRIVEELRSKKVSYELSPGGTIMVSADRVYDLRLDMASQGLPQGGGIGFEIFDSTNFTTSEFVQKLNFRRALEGELSRTIRSLKGVEQCRVHLVTPDKSVFAFQQNRASTTAAVFISLNKGRKLTSSEVDGIIHLVSSSVEDLLPENITVVDDRGELLTRPSDDSAMSLSGSQMEYRQGYENNLMTKIVGILEPVVGRGKVRARVSSSFDFTRSERTEETFDPDGVVVRSEQKSTEKTSSGMMAGSGVPGTASNLPGGGGAAFSPSQGQSQKQDEMINYETSKTITRIVESPVTLERITVAILIDGILPSQKDSIKNADQYVVRSEDDIKFYEDIVKKTIGFTEDRGDEISVNVMPFEQVEVPVMEEAGTDYMPMVLTAMKYVVPIIIFLVLYIMVLKPLLKAITSAAPHRTSAAGVAAIPGKGPAGEIPLQTKEVPVDKQVMNWAHENPQQAATLVKGWLEE